MRVLILLLLLVGVMGKANAEYFTKVGDLLRYCQTHVDSDHRDLWEHAQEAELASQCSGYVKGIVDAEDALNSWGYTEKHYCLPPKVTTQQLVRVVVKSIEEVPEYHHMSAGRFVLTALHAAFPCD